MLKICKICKKNNTEIPSEYDQIKKSKQGYYRAYCNKCDRKLKFDRKNIYCKKCNKNKIVMVKNGRNIHYCDVCETTKIMTINERARYYYAKRNAK